MIVDRKLIELQYHVGLIRDVQDVAAMTHRKFAEAQASKGSTQTAIDARKRAVEHIESILDGEVQKFVSWALKNDGFGLIADIIPSCSPLNTTTGEE